MAFCGLALGILRKVTLMSSYLVPLISLCYTDLPRISKWGIGGEGKETQTTCLKIATFAPPDMETVQKETRLPVLPFAARLMVS